MTSDQARARVGRPRSVDVEVVLTSTRECRQERRYSSPDDRVQNMYD